MEEKNETKPIQRKDEKKRLVIQSFYITTSHYNFSADEKKILSRLIEFMQPMLEGQKLDVDVKIDTDLWGNKRFELPINFFYFENDNKTRVKKALFDLTEKYLIIIKEGKERKVNLITWPAMTRRGIFEFYLHKDLVDLFVNFSKGYNRYRLDVSLSLKSVYAMRVYELISNQRQHLTWRISRLKEMFQIEEKQYSRNGNFIKRVIQKSKEELDEKANWSFEYEVLKKGNAYEFIRFKPIHFPLRETEETIGAEVKRQLALSNFVERNLKNYLINTCGFSARELKNNSELLQKFSIIFRDNADVRIREIWARAREARKPKAYLIGSIKNEVENI